MNPVILVALSIIVAVLAIIFSFQAISIKKNKKLIVSACIANVFSVVPMTIIALIVLYGGFAVKPGDVDSLVVFAGKQWILLWPLCYFVAPFVAGLFFLYFLKHIAKEVDIKEPREKAVKVRSLLFTSINYACLFYIAFSVLVPDA